MRQRLQASTTPRHAKVTEHYFVPRAHRGLFALSDGTLIDGAQGGNATRHLNHAFEPNCEAVEDYDEGGRLTVRIETTQSIRASDELFLDYALDIDVGDDPSDYPCHCGLARCRETLVASVES